MGHNVKLMALSSSNPVKTNSMMLQTLKLFVKSLDLTWFVPVKTAEQQAIGTSPESSELHQTANRTSQSNQGVIGRIWHCRPPRYPAATATIT
jgi:hypothetical protein